MRRLAMVTLWPSFLVAALAEGLFFSLFDPRELPLDSLRMPLSPLGAYTLYDRLFPVLAVLRAGGNAQPLPGLRAFGASAVLNFVAGAVQQEVCVQAMCASAPYSRDDLLMLRCVIVLSFFHSPHGSPK
jgi:hypothetical protein